MSDHCCDELDWFTRSLALPRSSSAALQYWKGRADAIAQCSSGMAVVLFFCWFFFYFLTFPVVTQQIIGPVGEKKKEKKTLIALIDQIKQTQESGFWFCEEKHPQLTEKPEQYPNNQQERTSHEVVLRHSLGSIVYFSSNCWYWFFSINCMNRIHKGNKKKSWKTGFQRELSKAEATMSGPSLMKKQVYSRNPDWLQISLHKHGASSEFICGDQSTTGPKFFLKFSWMYKKQLSLGCFLVCVGSPAVGGSFHLP